MMMSLRFLELTWPMRAGEAQRRGDAMVVTACRNNFVINFLFTADYRLYGLSSVEFL